MMFASCASISTPKKQPALTGTNWVLVDQVKGVSPTIVFEEGKISGSAGCNKYFGPVTLDPATGSFSAGELASTKKMCENMSVEDTFLKMLSSANSYKINGTNLELYKDGLILMKLSSIKK